MNNEPNGPKNSAAPAPSDDKPTAAFGDKEKKIEHLPVPAAELTTSGRGDGAGRTSIEDPVYFEIAYREARSVPGIVDVKGSFFEMLTGHSKGIHVKTSDTAVILELRIALEYGRFIPDVVAEVRKRIAQAIKRMTDREVRSIKVTIDRLVEGYNLNDTPRLDTDEDSDHIDF